MIDTDKKAELKKLVEAAEAALEEAERFAEEHKLSFYYIGPAYGMGGYFEGDTDRRGEYEKDFGWSPSSGSC